MRPLKEKTSVGFAIASGALAVIVAALSTWAAVIWGSLPADAQLERPDLRIPATLGFLFATLLSVCAVNFWLRRSPCAPVRPKDFLRPVVAGAAVAGGMLSMFNPAYALISVAAASLGTWANLSTGFWAREL